MKKIMTIGVLVMVILILSYIFLKTVQFITPVLILLGLIIICVGALVWVVKSAFEKKE